MKEKHGYDEVTERSEETDRLLKKRFGVER